MSKTSKQTVLVTGASGVVGRDLVDLLRRHHEVIALVHEDRELPDVEAIEGDVTVSGLGLAPASFSALARRVDVIVHSAALTTWGLPDDTYRPINIEGTRNVLELAVEAKASLQLISSCFVLALESPEFDDIVGESNVVRPYIRSKRAAERIVADSGVPYNIYRPTNLVGHSTSGVTTRQQIVQMMTEWIARGKAPYFPAHDGNLIDVAPVDMVSAAVLGAIASGESGQELWITYGADSMSVSDTLREIERNVAREGRKLPHAPIVDPREEPPMPMHEVPAMSRTFLKVLVDVSQITHACGGVLPSSLPKLRADYGASSITCPHAFRQSLEYWSERRRA